MKQFNLKLLSLAFLMILGLQLNAQTVQCNSNINISLGVWNCEATLFPDILLEGPASGFDTLWLDDYTLDYSDVGAPVTVTLFGINAAGVQSSCTSSFTVEDKIAPVAIGEVGVIVTLDANGTFLLSVDAIDDGSYDHCSQVSRVVSPSVITCGMPNPVLVTLTVTDDSGNYNQVISEVYYEDANGGTLACASAITASYPAASEYEVTIDEVLEAYSGDCADAVWMELVVNGQNRPDHTLDNNDYGANIVATLNAGNGTSCWTQITAVNEECEVPFTDANVLWPADLNDLSGGDCFLDASEYSPEKLMVNFNLDSSQVYPMFQNLANCHYTAIARSDQFMHTIDQIKILRDWTVIEWYNATVLTHIQIIKIGITPVVFCDTLAWDTPVGDCASGHTYDDNVEWPADITIDNLAYLPSQLASNPDVHPNNVAPQFDTPECFDLFLGENTIYTAPANPADPITVEQMYGAWSSTQPVSYSRTITITQNHPTTYCAYRKSGDPIPGVEMAPGFVTDATGCVDLAAYTGNLVAPEKFSPAQEGLDVNDQVAVYENILQINPFNCQYQEYAADINANGAVTALDAVLLARIIDGIDTPPQEDIWTFFNPVSGAEALNISDNPTIKAFVGVKLGDVNDSYDLGNLVGTPNESELFVDDEVLNNGQVYRVAITHPVTEKIKGFNVTLDNSDAASIKNVFAPLLKDFSFENNVKIENGKININYVAPQDELNEGGILVNNSAPLFTLIVEAKANGILSEEIALTDSDINLIKLERFNDAALLSINWEGQIVNKTDDPLSTTSFSIAPNPTDGLLQIRLDENQTASQFNILDISGSSMMTGDVKDDYIDVSNLKGGMYIIELQMNDGVRASQKFIKL